MRDSSYLGSFCRKTTDNVCRYSDVGNSTYKHQKATSVNTSAAAARVMCSCSLTEHTINFHHQSRSFPVDDKHLTHSYLVIAVHI